MPKKYTTEFKDTVVEFYERGHSVSETLTEYRISESSLFDWKKDYDIRNPDYLGDVLKRRDGYKRADHDRKLEEIIAVMNITRCKPSASISEKMAMIKALEDQYSIHVLCDAVHLPRGTYYNRKKREGQLNRYQEADEKIKPLIREVFLHSKRRFGRKPIQQKLREMGHQVSETRIARLMKEMGLQISRPAYMAAHLKSLPREHFQDLLHQQFHQIAPNLVWVTDITYIKVGSSYFYVCVIIDLFSRMILRKLSSVIRIRLSLNKRCAFAISNSFPSKGTRLIIILSTQGCFVPLPAEIVATKATTQQTWLLFTAGFAMTK